MKNNNESNEFVSDKYFKRRNEITNDEYIRSEAKAIYNYANRENYNLAVLQCMISKLDCLISKKLYGYENPAEMIDEMFDRKKEKENEQIHKN